MSKDRLLSIRHDVQASVISAVPHNIAKEINGMQLISETLTDLTYRSTWMSADLKKCVVLMLDNLVKPNYPAVMVRFGF